MGGKLPNGTNIMHVISLACVRVSEGESKYFRIDSGVRLGCIMSSYIFNVCMDAVIKEGNWGWRGRSEISGGGERIDFSWPSVLW